MTRSFSFLGAQRPCRLSCSSHFRSHGSGSGHQRPSRRSLTLGRGPLVGVATDDLLPIHVLRDCAQTRRRAPRRRLVAELGPTPKRAWPREGAIGSNEAKASRECANRGQGSANTVKSGHLGAEMVERGQPLGNRSATLWLRNMPILPAARGPQPAEVQNGALHSACSIRSG